MVFPACILPILTSQKCQHVLGKPPSVGGGPALPALTLIPGAAVPWPRDLDPRPCRPEDLWVTAVVLGPKTSDGWFMGGALLHSRAPGSCTRGRGGVALTMSTLTNNWRNHYINKRKITVRKAK